MMKWICIILLLLGFSTAATANTSDWQWNFMHWLYVGTDAGASDNYDLCDVPPQPEDWAVHVDVYHEFGQDGWAGPTGFYSRDLRAPLDMTLESSKTWRVYLWADATLNPDRTTIGLSWFGGGVSQEALERIAFRLTYIRSAIGIEDHRVGMSALLNEHPDGSSWWFDACRTENGLDGYVFDLTATVIPEPSALAALLCGLGGVLLRRQK